MLRHMYDFVAQATRPQRLWGSARREARAFCGILPLLTADLRVGWDGTLTCTDASPDGFGVLDDARADCACGRWSEQWRFKQLEPSQWKPRARALGHDRGAQRHACLMQTCMWRMRGSRRCRPRCYSVVVVMHGRWRHKEDHITLKEGRTVVLALRRRKDLLLVDNLALAFALSKGRCSSYPLLRVLQRGALLLAFGGRLRVRWVPGELNVADGASRGKPEPGPAELPTVRPAAWGGRRAAPKAGLGGRDGFWAQAPGWRHVGGRRWVRWRHWWCP